MFHTLLFPCNRNDVGINTVLNSIVVMKKKKTLNTSYLDGLYISLYLKYSIVKGKKGTKIRRVHSTGEITELK